MVHSLGNCLSLGEDLTQVLGELYYIIRLGLSRQEFRKFDWSRLHLNKLDLIALDTFVPYTALAPFLLS